jgi:alkylation response protein AidB-like acyl-CoA dehydrogenase
MLSEIIGAPSLTEPSAGRNFAAITTHALRARYGTQRGDA